MEVFRIVQQVARTKDLSGTGAFRSGGRWNSKGVYMLYTASNSSLALLESLVHFDPLTVPPEMYIMTINVDDAAPLFELPLEDYPKNWTDIDLVENKNIGDKWMADKKFLGFKVRSAVNSFEFNYLLNPLFPDYNSLVKVKAVTTIEVDGRLIGI
jgi:RES domain-containing protein